MKKSLKIMAVSCLTLVLAACHHPQNANQTDADNSKAQAYAMGQKGGLNGSDANGGGQYGARYVNSLQAPSHQVYYFAFNQSAVSQSDMRAIRAQANYLVSHRNAKVRLEGNTDDRGSREYNVGLGWDRAKAVARVLQQQGVIMKQHDAPGNQIVMVSYGKEHPAVSGDSEQAWSLNRRVELIYVQE